MVKHSVLLLSLQEEMSLFYQDTSFEWWGPKKEPFSQYYSLNNHGFLPDMWGHFCCQKCTDAFLSSPLCLSVLFISLCSHSVLFVTPEPPYSWEEWASVWPIFFKIVLFFHVDFRNVTIGCLHDSCWDLNWIYTHFGLAWIKGRNLCLVTLLKMHL